MEELIKKAIEGKYTGFLQDRPQWEKDIHFQLITLDPLFWQALGKACGWNRTMCMACLKEHKQKNDCDAGFGAYEPEWKYHALRFHEINLTSGWDAAITYLSALTKTK